MSVSPSAAPKKISREFMYSCVHSIIEGLFFHCADFSHFQMCCELSLAPQTRPWPVATATRRPMANTFSNMLLFDACAPDTDGQSSAGPRKFQSSVAAAAPTAGAAGAAGAGEQMPELFHFDERGAAEPIRLCFALRGVPYQEITVGDPAAQVADTRSILPH